MLVMIDVFNLPVSCRQSQNALRGRLDRGREVASWRVYQCCLFVSNWRSLLQKVEYQVS
jgi:hypothetical protein